MPHTELVGLENNLKGEDRFREKVAVEHTDKPGTPIEQLVNEIPDAIRYTLQSDCTTYVPAYWEARQELESRGFELTLSRNRWGSEEYKGINTRWVSAEGQVFEVQFHTPESFQAKELTHPAYERLRTDNDGGPERPELEKFQQRVSSCIPIPEGVNLIPDYEKEG